MSSGSDRRAISTREGEFTPAVRLAVQEVLGEIICGLFEVEQRSPAMTETSGRGIWLRDAVAQGPADAFLRDQEIGCFRPHGSLLIALPP